MVQRVTTVAFEGIEARAVDVQVQVAPGLPAFNVVGLPDKAVSEARERVRSALVASGLGCPPAASPSTWRPPTCQRRTAKISLVQRLVLSHFPGASH
jgi:Subunit ChlI of Mg-chelatase